MIFVIKCSNPKCNYIQTRTILGDLVGKSHVCFNCKKSFVIKSTKKYGLNGNTYGPFIKNEDAMNFIARLKQDELNKSETDGFFSYVPKGAN